MKPREHYLRAEYWLEQAGRLSPGVAGEQQSDMIATAQVHATLSTSRYEEDPSEE